MNADPHTTAEGLTENERALIAEIIDRVGMPSEIKKWMRYVIERHDALAADLAAVLTERDSLREAIETMMALPESDRREMKAVGRAALASVPASKEERP